MALDLSALKEKSPAVDGQAQSSSSGKPLEIPLVDIEEDPDQPRKDFSEATLKEMTESIRERGVKTPVSVRSHPKKLGKWMLNYGARRYRGSLNADRETIPAFIDESHENYDQVIENIQRDDLKPMELALFIKKCLDAGNQKKTIAKKLGKDGAIITQHLALIDLPACIEDAYSSGRCTSPRTLYELRGLFEKYPSQVEAWCENESDITRKTVLALADELKGKKKPARVADTEQPCDGGATKFGHDQILCADGEQLGGDSSSVVQELTGTPISVSALDDGGGSDATETEGPTKQRAPADPNKIAKPLMLVEFDGRAAAVLLNHRPTTSGLIHIRYEDGGGEDEVDAGACKINLLTDAEA